MSCRSRPIRQIARIRKIKLKKVRISRDIVCRFSSAIRRAYWRAVLRAKPEPPPRSPSRRRLLHRIGGGDTGTVFALFFHPFSSAFFEPVIYIFPKSVVSSADGDSFYIFGKIRAEPADCSAKGLATSFLSSSKRVSLLEYISAPAIWRRRGRHPCVCATACIQNPRPCVVVDVIRDRDTAVQTRSIIPRRPDVGIPVFTSIVIKRPIACRFRTERL